MSYVKNPSCKLFDAVMSLAHKDIENPKGFTISDDVCKVEYCEDSGLLPCEHCRLDPRGNRISTGYFLRGTEPKEECNIHKPITIDIRDGLEADAHTPNYARLTLGLLDYSRPDFPYSVKTIDTDYLIESRKRRISGN